MSNQQKYVAIGDIHGCAASFRALMDKLEADNLLDDRVIVFVGDYIDRGPSSKEVIVDLLVLREKHECVFLRGNHEQMMIKAFDRDAISTWMLNGGEPTMKSYGENLEFSNIPSAHMEFIHRTFMYLDTEDYFFVHAGADPKKTIEENINHPNADLYFLWRRDHLQVMKTEWEKKVVFGHTPMENPYQFENMIGIDTGCVYKNSDLGKLTAVLLPEETFIQQDCIDNI